MIILNKKNKVYASGGFGSYYRISKQTGVKIIRDNYFTSLKDLNSVIEKNDSVIKEASIGILADQLTKGIEIVKIGKKYYLGIVQKHFEQTNTYDLSVKDFDKIRKSLKKKNVIHGDLHEGNILFKSKSNYKVIDFDPDRSYYVGPKRNYYIVKNSLIKKIKEDIQLKNKR